MPGELPEDTKDFGSYVDDVLDNADIEDDTDVDTDVEIDVDSVSVDEGDQDEIDILSIQSHQFSEQYTPTIFPEGKKVWLKRSYLAPNENDQEYYLFKLYCGCGKGRTLQYISTISNISATRVQRVAKENNWIRRSMAYDSYMLEKRIAESQDSRHQEHIAKLEQYRDEQEMIGKQMSTLAAKLLLSANQTVDSLLQAGRGMPLDDLAKNLTVASKLAEVGKNIQSTALGVDQLMNALDESEE